MKKNKKLSATSKVIIICAAVLLAAGIFTGGYFLFFQKSSSQDIVYVSKVSAIMGNDLSSSSFYSGVVDPQKTVSVEKDSSRTINEIKVAVGQSVNTGDVLFSYNTEDTSIKLAQAQLEKQNIESTIQTLQSQLSQLKTEKNSAPSSEQLAYTVKIQSCEIEINTQNLTLSEKNSEIENINKALANSDVNATCQGIVKAINSNGTDMNGNPLPFMSIQMEGQYRIRGTVSETHINEISVGMPITVISRIDQSKTWSGTVSSVETNSPISSSPNDAKYMSGYAGGSTTESTTKYNFYITLDSLDGLILGQHLYIKPGNIENNVPDGSVHISEFYIATENSSSYVWKMNEKTLKIEKCPVTLGEYNKELSEYKIESGLSLDDYIAYPSENIKVGMNAIKGVGPETGSNPANTNNPAGINGPAGGSDSTGVVAFTEEKQ